MLIREVFVNETKGYQFGESDWYEPFTDDVGRLFLDLQREYGRCRSKVYRDLPTGGAQAIGWVFEKRMEYDDYRGHGERYYVRSVWVTVADRVENFPARAKVEYHTVGK